MVMNCKYCNRLFQPRLPNQVTCGEDGCRKALSRERAKKWYENKKEDLIEEKEEPVNLSQTVKPHKVCKGCKYRKKFYEYMICNYIEMEGHSRLVVEMNNGGYRTDTCVCYKK